MLPKCSMIFLGMDLGAGNFEVYMSEPVRPEGGGRCDARSLSQMPLPVLMSVMCGLVMVERYCHIKSGSSSLLVRPMAECCHPRANSESEAIVVSILGIEGTIVWSAVRED